MKILLLLLTFVFLVFAYLQLNDPDPIHWTLGYLAIAVSCGLAAFGRYPKWWLWGVTLTFGIWMLLAAPGILHWAQQGFPDITGEMKASTPVIEDSREFLGLLIAFAVMVFLIMRSRIR